MRRAKNVESWVSLSEILILSIKVGIGGICICSTLQVILMWVVLSAPGNIDGVLSFHFIAKEAAAPKSQGHFWIIAINDKERARIHFPTPYGESISP